MISWAPATLPASTMALIIASWSAVNCTPLRLSAAKPATGSFSALPTCIAALSRSMPNACDMSRMDCVALPKFSPLMLVKVARTFCAPRMASSENNDWPDVALMALAIFAISAAVNPAAPPVDLITASVCAMTESNAAASSIAPPMKSVTAPMACLPNCIAMPAMPWPMPCKTPVIVAPMPLNDEPALPAFLLTSSSPSLTALVVFVASSSLLKRISTVSSAITS